MRHLSIAILILFASYICRSQTSIKPNGSFNIEIGLPTNTTNKAFKELMQGLVIVTPSYQYTFDNTFAVAVGLRYGYFNVNQFKNTIGLKGGLHLAGIFAKIGQEKYFGKFGIDYGVRVGYAMNFFATNKNKEALGKPFRNESVFVEPHLGLCLLSTENSSFRLSLGYAFHGFEFRPDQMGIDKFYGIKKDDLNEITTYFTIGFGYSFYFGQK